MKKSLEELIDKDIADFSDKARKDAKAINKLVFSNQLDPKDFDSLITLGISKEAVACWKKYYEQRLMELKAFW